MMPTATCQYCGRSGPADQCDPLENAWERVEDLGSSGFRVAVYRETPKRDTAPRGYLRIEPA